MLFVDQSAGRLQAQFDVGLIVVCSWVFLPLRALMGAHICASGGSCAIGEVRGSVGCVDRSGGSFNSIMRLTMGCVKSFIKHDVILYFTDTGLFISR